MRIHIGTKKISITNDTNKSIWYLFIVTQSSKDVALNEMKSGETIEVDGFIYRGLYISCPKGSDVLKFRREDLTSAGGFNLNAQA